MSLKKTVKFDPRPCSTASVNIIRKLSVIQAEINAYSRKRLMKKYMAIAGNQKTPTAASIFKWVDVFL
jgi:hypothetical protein